jgi:hypothetical protein
LTSLPGIATSWPASIQRFHTYTWSVKGAGSVSGGGTVRGEAPLQYRNMTWTNQVLTTNLAVGGQSQGKEQFVAGAVGSPWMSPAFLQRLRPGQQIDAEAALQYRVFVGAVDPTFVTIAFANKTQRAEYTYRKSTGDLVAFSGIASEGIHASGTEATFVSRR